MPAVQPRVLVDAIINAFQESGVNASLISPVRSHPRKFVITTLDGQSGTIWIYAWTLTPGGRRNLPFEYRIQKTTVTSPLQLNPTGQTVLLGYEPNLGLFAGFDLMHHRVFTPGSPSAQIDIRVVENALTDGLTFDRKSNEEIAIGIRPDQLWNYVTHALEIHELGSHSATLTLLEKATRLEDVDQNDGLAKLGKTRQRIVRLVSTMSRAASFRKQVMHAYGNRCCVTKMQLRLAEAAHIVPVETPGSVDEVQNGLSLSPTYHRAYDRGLIYLDEDYHMRISPGHENDLKAQGLQGGILKFKSSLGRIYLPPDKSQWPNPSYITKANRIRGVPR